MVALRGGGWYRRGVMRVAILGSGGAGITTAWLLDEVHHVTVYERSPRLGGHANTVKVERDGAVHHADDGFAWFSDTLYPAFMRLLELHQVATRLIPMSLAFIRREHGRTHVLPPNRLGSYAGLLADRVGLIDMLRFKRALDQAAAVVSAGDRSLSFAEFVARHRYPEPFVREVLRPLLGGIWGAPYDRIDDCSLYSLAKYPVIHRPGLFTRHPWHVVRDGANAYIERVAAGLRAEILRATGVVGLERADAGGWTVVDDRGGRRRFDHVVFAMGARDAARILADTPGLAAVQAALGRFETYTVRVATHGDRRVMPADRRDWCVTNVNWDGQTSNLTAWTGMAAGADVFTSYVGTCEPAAIDHVSTFHLPLPSTALHRAQERLAARQGADDLSFAGDWTHDFGSHEDAVQSAMRVCDRLAPNTARLAALRAPRATPRGRALPGPIETREVAA